MGRRWTAHEVAHLRRATAGVKDAGRRNKYGAVRMRSDGYTFDSKAELARYAQLKLMQYGGGIGELLVHRPFELIVNGIVISKYIADFCYTGADGKWVIEDVKSVPTRTPSYRLKKRLMLALYGIEIQEIMACPK